MQIRYEEETDSMSFKLKTTKCYSSEEIAPNMIFHFDRNGDVAIVQVLDIKLRTQIEVVKALENYLF
jgi:NADH:ubiquinone oxidoreductase subunit E